VGVLDSLELELQERLDQLELASKERITELELESQKRIDQLELASKERIARLELELKLREEQLRLARLEKYGPKGEQLSQDQVLLLDLEPGVQAEEVAKEAALPEAEKRLKGSPAKTQRTGPRYSKAHPGRIPLPAHLPRREVIIPCEEGAGGVLVGYEVRGSKKESSSKPTKPGCRFCSKRARDATTPHGSGNTPNPEVWFTSIIKTVAAGSAPATFSAILRVVCKPTVTKCTRHWVLTLLKTRSIPSSRKTGNLR
jgi:hypothetical protein